jgi:hypothetical protein
MSKRRKNERKRKEQKETKKKWIKNGRKSLRDDGDMK